MFYQMLSCHSTAASMENGQCVSKSAAEIVMEVWRITDQLLLDRFVILVQDIVWLIVVCVFWWLFFHKIYHPLKIYFQGRVCKARQTKLWNDYREHSEKEKAAIALHLPLASSAHHPGKAPEEITNGGVPGAKVLVPVRMCCTCTLSCPKMSCKRKLEKLAKEVCAPRQPVTCLETKDFGCVAVQTHLHPGAETADMLEKIAAQKFCSEVTVQLGRCRAYLVDGEVKPMDIDKSDSSEKSNQVPVIFNSSHKADTLTVEGVNLEKASINIVNNGGDCIPLKKKCKEESEGPGVAGSTVSDEELVPSTFSIACTYSVKNDNIPVNVITNQLSGAGGLEMHTYPIGTLEGARGDEFSVIAFKKIIKDGSEVRVSSLPVQIQDHNLRTVLRDILPCTIIVFFAAKQILSIVGFATLVVAWVISFMIIALTSTLPESIETTIKQLLEKMIEHACIFSEVCRTYKILPNKEGDSEDEEHDSEDEKDGSEDEEDDSEDEEDGSEDEEDIARMQEIKRQAAKDGPKTDRDPSCSVIEVGPESNFQGSRFVHSVDWQWPIYDTVYQNGESYLQLRKESKDEKMDQNSEAIPFEVIYLKIKNLPWASQVQVKIFSPFLISLLPTNTDRWKLCKKEVIIDGPELFRNYAALSAYRASCVAKVKSPQPSTQNTKNVIQELQHITHLVRFMDKEFEVIKPMYAAMETERQVTWGMLWAFLPPEERVVYVDEVTDECVCGKVLWTEYRETAQGQLLLVVKVTKWDYNCLSWNEYTNKVTVPAFAGDREIKSLSVRPLRLEEDPNATETSFLNHGKRFCELSMMQSNCYMEYRGSLVSYVQVDNCLRIVKENADGRVMIDLGSFAKMNPDFPLGSAKPPCEIIRDNITVPVDITQSHNRMFAPSFVYGFSFRLKKWGCFSLAGFTDIEFNDSAYDGLVMNPDTKTLINSLVQERLKESSKKEGRQAESHRVDPIENKGNGCILLCYGPPGTGKTLTAESLSEKLECPLWCLNVFELGVTPAALETMLMKVLDVAASWGAILLLDEADVYLERRSSKDLVRNSMTSVFLRHLEYYRGVLFLTTNRDAAFDEAICSRITMFLYYGRHNECQRSEIWKTLFRRLGLEDCTSETLAEFSKPDFNGREITKIVKTAQTLAKSKNEGLEFRHIRDALQVYEESSKLRTSLNSSTGGASTLPAHQQLIKQLLERLSTSAPPELHPSSTVSSADVVEEECPLDFTLSSNFSEDTMKVTQTCESNGTETQTSDQGTETIEAVTPTSESNETIQAKYPSVYDCYLR